MKNNFFSIVSNFQDLPHHQALFLVFLCFASYIFSACKRYSISKVHRIYAKTSGATPVWARHCSLSSRIFSILIMHTFYLFIVILQAYFVTSLIKEFLIIKLLKVMQQDENQLCDGFLVLKYTLLWMNDEIYFHFQSLHEIVMIEK
jgi:hypothetical protein